MLLPFSTTLFEDYFPLIISNLLVILFFLFFSKQQKKADTVYQNHIARLEARSLRAQMNPHFIYNALNSIQSVMLLKGERETNTITSVNDVASETNQDAILALLKRILVKNAANREALKEQ